MQKTIILYSVQDLGEYTQQSPRNPTVEEMVKMNEEFEVFMKNVYENEPEWSFDELTSNELMPHESQVLWYAVTQSMANSDTNKASDWKHFIEERQRKLRSEYKSEKYIPRYYTETQDWLPYKFKVPSK
eukprot:NODE_1034_length_1896_cov_0.159711.p2 type:complete len:129 gc:universal NODE_1034_length_1896_cov_0.159711:560-174(-)